jgi:Fic family protein
MRAFNYSKIKEQKWDSEILGYIAAIYKEAGKQELYLKQRPEELERLVEIAKLQSTEASNAIEGIVTTSTRIKQLVEEKTTPRNRDEQEIAGYRDVLNLIHENFDVIPITQNYILQLHATKNKIGRFTKQDIRELCPSLSLSSIEGSLRKLVENGELKREGAGKSTVYLRLK